MLNFNTYTYSVLRDSALNRVKNLKKGGDVQKFLGGGLTLYEFDGRQYNREDLIKAMLQSGMTKEEIATYFDSPKVSNPQVNSIEVDKIQPKELNIETPTMTLEDYEALKQRVQQVEEDYISDRKTELDIETDWDDIDHNNIRYDVLTGLQGEFKRDVYDSLSLDEKHLFNSYLASVGNNDLLKELGAEESDGGIYQYGQNVVNNKATTYSEGNNPIKDHLEAVEEAKKTLYKGVPGLEIESEDTKTEVNPIDTSHSGNGLSDKTSSAISMGVLTAVKVADQLAFTNANFDAQSQAADALTDAATSIANNFGPIGQAVGAGLQGLNFISKATGLTVNGFNVDIASSGYGDLGHKADKSNRGGFLGLGNLFNKDKIDELIRERNEQASLAMLAANIAKEQSFEKEAAANTAETILKLNQEALNGGGNMGTLAAKQGGKILKALNGAKLQDTELSEQPSIIPEGAMHKNKHNIDLEHITKKGIPVLLNVDNNSVTPEDIKALEENLLQACEIEENEIIFSGELTQYVEDAKKKYEENKDDDFLLEVGKRIVAEILLNTQDNTGLIEETNLKV